MTLDAQVIDCFVVDEMREFRTVGSVATQAVQSQIRIAWINDFSPDGVRRVGLPVVTLPTEFDT